MRKAELVSQMKQLIQAKRKNIAAQKDVVETVHTQLASCLSFVRESLKTGSQGEVMKMKKAVMKQIKKMTDDFNPVMLPPCEVTNIKFVQSSELVQACQQFGEVILKQACPQNCYATGKGLEVAKLGEEATAILHVVDDKGKANSAPAESLTCELVSNYTSKKVDCVIKETEVNQFEISF